MLIRDQIEKIAMDYLLKNNYPIVTPGRVTLPEDARSDKSKEFMIKRSIAKVSFLSNYPGDPLDPYRELTQAIFILHVNFMTGEVEMINPSR